MAQDNASKPPDPGRDADTRTRPAILKGHLESKEIPSMAEILDVTDNNFDSEVLKSETPVIVDFWAEWCQPCRQIAPIIKTLADDYEGRVKIVKVNVDDSQHVAGNFGIRSIPAVLSFRNGQVVDQVIGVRPKANFVEMAEKIL